MYDNIEKLCQQFESQTDLISEERKLILQRIAQAIVHDIELRNKAQLVFICTHNSRRSHIGQVWATTLAQFYGLSSKILAYSGGTEVTAFHPNTKRGLEHLGFKIDVESKSINPVHKVSYGKGLHTLCFSKQYDAEVNPKTNMIAIMTCAHADENCPFIPGASSRFATPYEDPKVYDDTVNQNEAYLQCILKIGNEMAYMLSQIDLKKDYTNRS